MNIVEFMKLIDKEELILDTKRLSEWKRNAGKQELIEKIDNLAETFISENISADDFEAVTLVYKLISEIKDII